VQRHERGDAVAPAVRRDGAANGVARTHPPATRIFSQAASTMCSDTSPHDGRSSGVKDPDTSWKAIVVTPSLRGIVSRTSSR
jgi:hypothetical protein